MPCSAATNTSPPSKKADFFDLRVAVRADFDFPVRLGGQAGHRVRPAGSGSVARAAGSGGPETAATGTGGTGASAGFQDARVAASTAAPRARTTALAP